MEMEAPFDGLLSKTILDSDYEFIAGTWIPDSTRKNFRDCGFHYVQAKISWISNPDYMQSTPDNSNLQGKQKKVRVIEGKILI